MMIRNDTGVVPYMRIKGSNEHSPNDRHFFGSRSKVKLEKERIREEKEFLFSDRSLRKMGI